MKKKLQSQTLVQQNPIRRERWHELKKGLFSALKLGDLLHTGPKLELIKGTLLAHVDAPLSVAQMFFSGGTFYCFLSGQFRFSSVIRPRLHEQIRHALFTQIHPQLLHTDREFELLKVTLFAYVNKALPVDRYIFFIYQISRKFDFFHL